MVEIQRAPEAEADLVDHPHQQEVGEEQVDLLQVMQVEQPHQHVEVQKDQPQVDAAGAAVAEAQPQPARRA